MKLIAYIFLAMFSSATSPELRVRELHPYKNETIISDLIGEWQLGTSVISSSKSNTYTFYKNKQFEYSTNGQDALIEVLKIKGTYYINHDTVFVKPTIITKRVGGHLSRNFDTQVNDFWEMTGGVLKTTKILSAESYPLDVKVLKKRVSIMINGAKYFKIQ